MDRSDEPTEVVDVVGLCENNDKFAKQRELPVTEIGDLPWSMTLEPMDFTGYQYNAVAFGRSLFQEDGRPVWSSSGAEKPEDHLATPSCLTFENKRLVLL